MKKKSGVPGVPGLFGENGSTEGEIHGDTSARHASVTPSGSGDNGLHDSARVNLQNRPGTPGTPGTPLTKVSISFTKDLFPVVKAVQDPTGNTGNTFCVPSHEPPPSLRGVSDQEIQPLSAAVFQETARKNRERHREHTGNTIAAIANDFNETGVPGHPLAPKGGREQSRQQHDVCALPFRALGALPAPATLVTRPAAPSGKSAPSNAVWTGSRARYERTLAAGSDVALTLRELVVAGAAVEWLAAGPADFARWIQARQHEPGFRLRPETAVPHRVLAPDQIARSRLAGAFLPRFDIDVGPLGPPLAWLLARLELELVDVISVDA